MTTPTPYENQIASASLVSLKEEFNRAAHDAETAKRKIKTITSELVRRYRLVGESRLSSEGKGYGSTSFENAGIKLKFELKQKVEWDQDILKEVARGLPKEVFEKVFKMDLSVPEGVYKNITDGNLVKALERARTTKLQEPSVTFAD